MKKSNELMVFGKVFEETDVEIISVNGEFLFELYSTAIALGQIKISKNKVYPRYERIKANLSNAQISTIVHNGQQYLTEEMLYDFMLEAGTNKCRTFRKWVTSEVLPELRQHGMYVLDNATEEQKMFNYKMIKSTFENCSIEKLEQLYKECISYYKDNKVRLPMKKSQNYRSDKKISTSDTRLRVMRDIKSIIDKRSAEYEKNKQFALSSVCDDVVKLIMEDISGLRQRISGGEKASKTKIINEINPSLDRYAVINCHGMSENYLYEAIIDENTLQQKMVKTEAYKIWINKFPADDLKCKYDMDVDWDKPIVVYLKFDCMEKFDVQNLSKSAIDQIITRCYGENDNIVAKIVSERNSFVNSYEDGKIYVFVKNV